MKLKYSLFILLIFLEISFVFGQLGTTMGDAHSTIDGESVNLDSVIRGEFGNRKLIQTILKGDSLDFFNRQLIRYPDALNQNSILREEWLKHYGIVDNSRNIHLEGQELVMNGELFVKVVDKTKFELNKISIKEIRKDGTIELENGALFLGGEISLDKENGKIIVDGGTLDITNFKRELGGKFKIIDAEVKLGEEIYSSTKNLIELLGLRSRSFFVPPVRGPNFFLEINNNEIIFQGKVKLDNANFIIKGEMKIDNEGNRLYKGIFADYGKFKVSDSLFIKSGENFFQYLKGDKPLIEGVSFIKNIDGDVSVFAKGLGMGKEALYINAESELNSIIFEKINDEGYVFYYKNGDLLASINNKGLMTQGLISELGNVKIIDPRTNNLESVSKIVGDIFNPDQLQKVREIKVAKELVDTIKDMQEPVAILISNQIFKDQDVNPLPGSHSAAEKMADYLIQQKGISKKKVYFVKDNNHQELIGELNKIRQSNPKSDFVIYASTHGDRDKETGGYFLTAQDTIFTEDGSFENQVLDSDFNKVFGDKKPIYIIDSCHAGGLCSGLNSRMSIAATQKDQIGSQLILNEEKRLYSSLFTEVLISPSSPSGLTWPQISLTDDLILNGLENKWLTEVYSNKLNFGKETPVVFRFVLSILLNNF